MDSENFPVRIIRKILYIPVQLFKYSRRNYNFLTNEYIFNKLKEIQEITTNLDVK